MRRESQKLSLSFLSVIGTFFSVFMQIIKSGFQICINNDDPSRFVLKKIVHLVAFIAFFIFLHFEN